MTRDEVGPLRAWIRELVPRRPSPGRRLIEERLLPAVAARDDLGRILFVGCSRRTRNYQRHFRDREYWTMDIDPAKARYGSDRHLVDSLENVDRHFEPGDLDAILCIGVFGWGLDEPERIATAIKACRRCLRRGGLFVVGWNDVDEYRPPGEAIEPPAGFTPTAFGPFASARCRTGGEVELVLDFHARATDRTEPA
jgi:SAM-dependent methyltransferase